jgi:hypothetical protein
MKKKIPRNMAMRARPPIPAPMPAWAAVVRPDVDEEEGVGEDVDVPVKPGSVVVTELGAVSEGGVFEKELIYTQSLHFLHMKHTVNVP